MVDSHVIVSVSKNAKFNRNELYQFYYDTDECAYNLFKKFKPSAVPIPNPTGLDHEDVK